ncbi:hypothetical protein QJQ45_000809 [Haematococcus lacustris]|nr:hypothetical protein QJQ45_000809 [Haematococcus lacustris]
MDLPATVVTSLVDLRIVPTFDSPWLCTSLADFWGRRWNITTSSVLRVLVYDPIVEGRLVASDDVHPKRLAAAQQLAAEPQPVLMFTSAAAGPTSRGALEPLAPASAKASAAVCEDEQPSHASSTDPDSASEDRSDVSTGMSEEGPTKSNAAAVTASRERPSAATRPPRWRRVCGTLATFLVSGLMHEWIMYMLMPRFLGPWTGKWTVYFTMQGPLLLCEVELKRAWRQAGLRPLPFLLACALTWATLLVVAVPFFFGAVQPPHGNLAPRVVAAVRDSFAAVGQLVEASLKHITVTLATWDAVWEVYLDPKWSRQRLRLYGAQDRALEQFFMKLEKEMAEVSMERHGRAKQLVVFFGAASIGTRGGWGADAVLRACRKVVCRPRGTDQRRGRVVLVDAHRTTRVSSAVNGKQPCEVELNILSATRPAGWKPPAGQVEQRLLRPAWSQQRDQPVRGLMWCPVVPPRKPPQAPRSSQEATTTAASEPGPSTPQPAKRSKRTKAEPAAEPTKGKGKGKAATSTGCPA